MGGGALPVADSAAAPRQWTLKRRRGERLRPAFWGARPHPRAASRCGLLALCPMLPMRLTSQGRGQVAGSPDSAWGPGCPDCTHLSSWSPGVCGVGIVPSVVFVENLRQARLTWDAVAWTHPWPGGCVPSAFAAWASSLRRLGPREPPRRARQAPWAGEAGRAPGLPGAAGGASQVGSRCARRQRGGECRTQAAGPEPAPRSRPPTPAAAAARRGPLPFHAGGAIAAEFQDWLGRRARHLRVWTRWLSAASPGNHPATP